MGLCLLRGGGDSPISWDREKHIAGTARHSSGSFPGWSPCPHTHPSSSFSGCCGSRVVAHDKMGFRGWFSSTSAVTEDAAFCFNPTTRSRRPGSSCLPAPKPAERRTRPSIQHQTQRKHLPIFGWNHRRKVISSLERENKQTNQVNEQEKHRQGKTEPLELVPQGGPCRW